MTKNKLQCLECLPVKSLSGHPSFKGILVHSRIDCPPDTIYFVNENMFINRTDQTGKL